jgi:hypothetical protein
LHSAMARFAMSTGIGHRLPRASTLFAIAIS